MTTAADDGLSHARSDRRGLLFFGSLTRRIRRGAEPAVWSLAASGAAVSEADFVPRAERMTA